MGAVSQRHGNCAGFAGRGRVITGLKEYQMAAEWLKWGDMAAVHDVVPVLAETLQTAVLIGLCLNLAVLVLNLRKNRDSEKARPDREGQRYEETCFGGNCCNGADGAGGPVRSRPCGFLWACLEAVERQSKGVYSPKLPLILVRVSVTGYEEETVFYTIRYFPCGTVEMSYRAGDGYNIEKPLTRL